ncbi:MAG: hypothetical protein KDJ52_14410 [Anaerolineae bacterium]|nr:hypothetical protein [Anaerolineae bacterium]
MTMVGINNSPPVGAFPPPREDYKLSDEQKGQLQDILSKYDAKDISEDDRRAMLNEIKDAGIRPGEDLKNALEDAGFKVKPPPSGDRPPRGLGNSRGPGFEPPQFVKDFMAKIEAGDVSDDDIRGFLETIQSQQGEPKGVFFDRVI